MIECGGVDRRAVSNDAIIAALEVEDPATIERRRGRRAFRMLADAVGADREALAAQARSVYQRWDRARADLGPDAASSPATRTRSPYGPRSWSRRIPDATLRHPRTADHIGALGDPRFSTSIVDFLADA